MLVLVCSGGQRPDPCTVASSLERMSISKRHCMEDQTPDFYRPISVEYRLLYSGPFHFIVQYSGHPDIPPFSELEAVNGHM